MSPICLCVLPLQTSIGIISIFPIFYLINANLLSNLKFSILFVTTRKSPSKVGSRPLVSFVVAHRTHSEGTLVIGIIITHSTISSNSLLCSYYDFTKEHDSYRAFRSQNWPFPWKRRPAGAVPSATARRKFTLSFTAPRCVGSRTSSLSFLGCPGQQDAARCSTTPRPVLTNLQLQLTTNLNYFLS